ncbi:hypothetical protein AGLY_003843 [Aphis glycines]|uniref:Uncharacterized protein n=1 Tax=Aphis glycines TaxID=307491 RepID=A0A6G0TZH6_APHGL|nr:hypothetical protein AGLY_003843 [Aphis glycines]
MTNFNKKKIIEKNHLEDLSNILTIQILPTLIIKNETIITYIHWSITQIHIDIIQIIKDVNRINGSMNRNIIQLVTREFVTLKNLLQWGYLPKTSFIFKNRLYFEHHEKMFSTYNIHYNVTTVSLMDDFSYQSFLSKEVNMIILKINHDTWKMILLSLNENISKLLVLYIRGFSHKMTGNVCTLYYLTETVYNNGITNGVTISRSDVGRFGQQTNIFVTINCDISVPIVNQSPTTHLRMCTYVESEMNQLFSTNYMKCNNGSVLRTVLRSSKITILMTANVTRPLCLVFKKSFTLILSYSCRAKGIE